ncbi:hypothetical protein ATDW_31590 [Asticcacaulis sp. DW145]|jgi:hypothetical protein|nr:hypothetical protein ATDW_31590 [Asticcacaulis sp. DW145]
MITLIVAGIGLYGVAVILSVIASEFWGHN